MESTRNVCPNDLYRQEFDSHLTRNQQAYVTRMASEKRDAYRTGIAAKRGEHFRLPSEDVHSSGDSVDHWFDMSSSSEYEPEPEPWTTLSVAPVVSNTNPSITPTAAASIDQGIAAMLTNGSLRVDQASKMVCLVDLAQMVCEVNQKHASKIVQRILFADDEISTKCRRLRINRKGKSLAVCDAATAIELIWLLPGKAAKEVRRQYAQQICRILGADPASVADIEARTTMRETWTSNNGVELMQVSTAASLLAPLVSDVTPTGASIDQGLAAMLSNGSLRVDQASKMVSAVDLASIITGKNKNNAAESIRHVCLQDNNFNEKVVQLIHIRINGKGKLTPVCDAATAIELIWLLPGKAAKEVRRHHAQQICRILGGDPSLIAELELRYMYTDPAVQEVMSAAVPANPAMENPEFRARTVKRARELDDERKHEAKKARADLDYEVLSCKLLRARAKVVAQAKRLHQEECKYTLENMQAIHKSFSEGPFRDPRIAQQVRDYANNSWGSVVITPTSDSMDLTASECEVEIAPPRAFSTVAEIIQNNLIFQGATQREVTAALQTKVTMAIGKRARAFFTKRHGTDSKPETMKKFVNGEERSVNVYHPDDHDLVIEAYEVYLEERDSPQPRGPAPLPTPSTILHHFGL